MPKVLIIGPRFYYFNESIERAFSALGFDTRILTFDNPVHPYNLINKIRYKLTKDKLGMKRESRQQWQPEADIAFSQYAPDIVFVMNGNMLLPETLKRWRQKGAKVVLWLFDSITYIPLCEDIITSVDKVFCYEQTDIPLIRKRYDIEACFLPQAVDQQLYYRIDDMEKQYDIVFAGDMVHSKKRREVVKAIVAHYPHLRIRIWGEYKLWYKSFWAWLTREHRNIYMNRNASSQQLNRDYNASRMVLNIHNEQQKDGANPKLYEIAATGTYQICDANPYIRQLFPDSELGLYTLDTTKDEAHRYDRLFECIDDALTHDKQQQAASARQIVLEHHTFEWRIRQVLSFLQNPTS